MVQSQLCTFWLDRLYLAVDVRDVEGVISHQPLTRVPLAPPAVRGLMNLRGEVIAGVDLRPCLELDLAQEDAVWVNVIVRGESGPMSLLVDQIGEVVAINEDQFEPPPETLPEKLREIAAGVCDTDQGLLLILHVERVIELASGAEADFGVD